MRLPAACNLELKIQPKFIILMSERNVSAINTAKSGNRYFDFTIQENEEQRRVVCFSPEKGSTLKMKEERKLPVRLVNVSPQKRRYEPDSTEYTMGKYSRVEEPKNLSF